MKSTHPESHRPRGIPQVVLIHGTFASDASDIGARWWQRDSAFWISLHEGLRGEATLVTDRELFRWKDDGNSDISRLKAALDLLRYIDAYENSGTPYHLVGHSHGGSVIWEALKLSLRDGIRAADPATAADAPLKYLLSWTTIGTPFIHKEVKPIKWMVSGAFTLVALLALGGATLFGLLMTYFWKRDDTLWSQATEVAPYLLVGWLTYVVLSGFVTSYDDGRRLRREAKLERLVLQRYGAKWFGMWSPDDEAINSLRGITQLRVSLFSDTPLERSPFVGKLWWILVLPAAWVMRLVYRNLGPFADDLISELLRRKALGDKRPAPKTFAVSPTPFAMKTEHPGLDDAAAARLRSIADATLGENAPLLRRLLKDIASNPGSAYEELASNLKVPDSLLVHTSYFLDPIARNLVLAHIALSQGATSIASVLPRGYLSQVARLKAEVDQLRTGLLEKPPNVLVQAFSSVPTWIFLVLGLGVGGALAVYITTEIIRAIVPPVILR